MKRNFGIIAATVLSAMAFSQIVSASEVVNPEDSGYLGPVTLGNGYNGEVAATASALSSSRFRAIVNPDDSGYLGPEVAATGV